MSNGHFIFGAVTAVPGRKYAKSGFESFIYILFT